MAKIYTVNVIDCKDRGDFAIERMESQPDTPEGNDLAEALWRQWVLDAVDQDAPPTEEELADALENGVFEIGEGCIAIVHSV